MTGVCCVCDVAGRWATFGSCSRVAGIGEHARTHRDTYAQTLRREKFGWWGAPKADRFVRFGKIGMVFSLAAKCSSNDTGGHFVNELCVRALRRCWLCLCARCSGLRLAPLAAGGVRDERDDGGDDDCAPLLAARPALGHRLSLRGANALGCAFGARGRGTRARARAVRVS